MELKQLPITLCMVVRNSNGRLKDVIKAHRDVVSEVVVVDQSSDDGTYEEALEHADFVFKRTNKGTADPDRNFAFSCGSQPWVLYIDDDERLAEETKHKLEAIINSNADIIWFKRRNFVDGIDLTQEIGDDPQCRLFKRGAVTFPDQIHTYPTPANGATVLYSNYWLEHHRTLEGLKKANKLRERVASPEQKKLQDDFIYMVENTIKSRGGFKDNWYSDDQLRSLEAAVELVKGLVGDIVEIGCWEGKSTCAIANKVYPEFVKAIDTWAGNIAEGNNHPSVIKAKERDVYEEFNKNIKARTFGNVIAQRIDCFDYLKKTTSKIKFCHIDAAHDYDSVRRTIQMLKPLLVPGAVLCGDDFVSAGAHREDLGGGVEKAVREECPGFRIENNFWYWVAQ